MKKRILVAVIILVILLLITALIGVAWFLHSDKPKMPFKNLDSSDVKNIYLPIGVFGTFTLTEDEKQEVISILNDIVIYEANLKVNKDPADRDNHYVGMNPQVLIIELNSGFRFQVDPQNPFLRINEIYFKTDYTPCDHLSSCHRQLRQNYHPVT